MNPETVDDTAGAQTEDRGAGECPVSLAEMALADVSDAVDAADAALDAPSDAKPNADALFRQLQGLTSMMDSVTQSLIGARAEVGQDRDCGAGEGAAGELDPTDSLPLTTSFMSSSGALPPGTTQVDYCPLAGSSAASLTISQMSNEGLASSVEGLNISQISNEGMATSAFIDSSDLGVPIPVCESPEESPSTFSVPDNPPLNAAPDNPAPQSVASPCSETQDSETQSDNQESKSSEPEQPQSLQQESQQQSLQQEPQPQSLQQEPQQQSLQQQTINQPQPEPQHPPAAPVAAAKSAPSKKSPSPTAQCASASAPASTSSSKSRKAKKSSPAHPKATTPVDAHEGSPVPKESPDNVLKNLASYATAEAKLTELCLRHAQAVTQNRDLESRLKTEQRRSLTVMKEKESLSCEHQKTILAKSKLESLCRELQKHSKMIKDEAVKRAQLEEAKRKEVADSFQSTIEDVTSRMTANSERNNALRDQNEELASKMKHLVDQYEKREEQIEKILKHKDLECQLAQAKLDRAEAEKKEILEKSEKEKELLLAQTLESVKKTQMLEQNEKHLRAQIELYTEKYDEFQSTLSKSNTVFNNFKSEMAQMTKKIKKLEKEIQMWKGRWETSNTQLEKVTKEKEAQESDLKDARGKTAKLEKLCRALQQERHSLTSQVTLLQNGNGETTETSGDCTIEKPLDNCVPASDG